MPHRGPKGTYSRASRPDSLKFCRSDSMSSTAERSVPLHNNGAVDAFMNGDMERIAESKTLQVPRNIRELYGRARGPLQLRGTGAL